MTSSGLFTDAPELQASYAACEAEVRQYYPEVWAAAELLPAEIQPYVHALHAFAARTDRVADVGALMERQQALAHWRTATTAGLRVGQSDDVLLRALVDTASRWELDRAVFEEFFNTAQADSAAPPAFETFADQRRYLRGMSGTIAELWAPMLGLRAPDAIAKLSLVGELFQLMDVFEDLPIDLAAGRCYLPQADLRRLGLEVADLSGGGKHHDALDELMDVQLGRGRELLDQAIPVVAMADLAHKPFLQAVLLGVQLQFDAMELVRSRALVEGIAPLTSIGLPDAAPVRLNTSAVSLDAGPVPGHVAVIMDGNRRWASQRDLPTAQGHRAGEWALVRTVHGALRLGVRNLSIFAFSTENWERSREELTELFETMAGAFARSTEWLHQCGVRVRWCGRRDRLDPSLASLLKLTESLTSNNSGLTLTLCVDYGGRDELAAAARALAAEAVAGEIAPSDIGPADFARKLYVPELPDVDLLIRTSGEQRISNFLLWHLAYAELVFDPTPWPDFGLAGLRSAIATYATRRRSFGGDRPGELPSRHTPRELTRETEPARVG